MKFFTKEEFGKIIKFVITGFINTIVDYSIAFLFFSLIGWPELYSQTMGFCAGVTSSFFINRKWTFKVDKTESGFFSPVFLKFLTVNLVSLAISLAFMALSTDAIFAGSALSEELIFLISKVFITCITVIINFIGSRFWVFKSTQPDSDGKKDNITK